MNILKKIKTYFLWILISIVLGCVCGLIGTAFAKVLTAVTNTRIKNDWLLYLLPLGGLISVFIYRLLRINGANTLNVFESTKENKPLPHGLPIAVFCGSAISHLLGASVGREGAALQIGGGVANFLGRALRLNETARKTMLLCGMAALFSALFGTPLAAAVFVIEIIATKLCFMAMLPITLSSIVSFHIATRLGVCPERFDIGTTPQISISFILKCVLIIVACVIISFVWCKGLSLAKKYSSKLFKNEYLRIAIGGVIIVLLTLIIDTRDYNGGGIDIVNRAFNGSVQYEAFALKLIFTVICVSAGFKGGEIVPTLFIGASLGGALAILLGLPAGICAGIGIAVLFCSSTKCPIATVFLCCEMFDFGCALIISTAVILGTVLSHFYKGLYDNKNHILSMIIKNSR